MYPVIVKYWSLYVMYPVIVKHWSLYAMYPVIVKHWCLYAMYPVIVKYWSLYAMYPVILKHWSLYAMCPVIVKYWSLYAMYPVIVKHWSIHVMYYLVIHPGPKSTLHYRLPDKKIKLKQNSLSTGSIGKQICSRNSFFSSSSIVLKFSLWEKSILFAINMEINGFPISYTSWLKRLVLCWNEPFLLKFISKFHWKFAAEDICKFRLCLIEPSQADHSKAVVLLLLIHLLVL